MGLASSLRWITQALRANNLLEEEETTLAKLIAFINPGLLHCPTGEITLDQIPGSLDVQSTMTPGIAAQRPSPRRQVRSGCGTTCTHRSSRPQSAQPSVGYVFHMAQNRSA
jgi:hypothetical protein